MAEGLDPGKTISHGHGGNRRRYAEFDVGNRKTTWKDAGRSVMARDSLIKLGLIYSPEHGKVAFTVPDMGEFILRAAPSDGQAYDGRRSNVD